MIYLLSITSLLMCLPVINNFFTTNDKITIVLDIILLLSFAISVIFWMNPLRNGTRHKFDSAFSKLSMFLFSVYVLFYKQNEWSDKIVYTLALSMCITLFCLSSSYSRQKWCSPNHVIIHAFFHTIIILTLNDFFRF